MYLIISDLREIGRPVWLQSLASSVYSHVILSSFTNGVGKRFAGVASWLPIDGKIDIFGKYFLNSVVSDSSAVS